MAALMRGRRGALHLYGKREARPGRKLAHVTLLAPSAPAALAKVEALHAQLGRNSDARRVDRTRSRIARAPAEQPAQKKGPVRPIVG